MFAITGNAQKKVNIVILINTGRQCTITGFGPMYDKFLETGEIKDFTGFGKIPATSSNPHFEDASVCLMNFIDSCGNVHYNCTKSVLFTDFDHILCVFLGNKLLKYIQRTLFSIIFLQMMHTSQK